MLVMMMAWAGGTVQGVQPDEASLARGLHVWCWLLAVGEGMPAKQNDENEGRRKLCARTVFGLSDETQEGEKKKVQTAHVHNNYARFALNSDIFLLTLGSCLTFLFTIN